MAERLNTQHDYFKSVQNIHERKWPIPQRELSQIVSSVMKGLSHTACAIDNMKIEKSSFLFYYQTLLTHNVSPINVCNDYCYDSKNKQVSIRRFYDIDITKNGAGWHLINQPVTTIPTLEWNNLWSRFHYIKDPFIKEYIMEEESKNYPEEFKKIILDRLRSGTLLRGDRRFIISSYQSFLLKVNESIKNFAIAGPSEQKLQEARECLADNKALTYIDLSGNEMTTGKTRFEAWEEFKREQPTLVNGLIFLCNLTPSERDPRLGKIYKLVDRAYTLLRIKGFPAYPDLAA